MRYIKGHLQDGEDIIHTTTVHWIVYVRAAVFFILAAYTEYFAFVGGTIRPFEAVGIQISAALLLSVAITKFMTALILRSTTELAITNLRIIIKTGFIRRTTFEMNRSKVESVLVDQSILGRALDFGTIRFKGVGASVEFFPNIDRPIEFRGHVTAG